jgi:FeS assembly SUF system regulator
MLRLTKQTDYAIVLLAVMACEPDGTSFSARDLSEAAAVPLPMTSKILKLLAREGLLASRRGVNGGYALARPAHQMSLADILGSLEGGVALTQCAEHPSAGNGTCAIESLCPISGIWRTINGALIQTLEGITVAQLAGSLPRRRVTAAQKSASLATAQTGT